MFKYLFNLSYERNLGEAKVFYFVYFLFACFIAGMFRFCTGILLPKIQIILTFCTPFIFYTLISVNIILKKELKDRGSFYCALCTIVLTLFVPLCFAWVSFIWSNFLHASFIQECGMAFRVCFFSGLILGCIPVAILSTKEDYSLNKEIQKMEQEKLEQERKIEKLLLTERAIASKLEEIKKHVNNAEEKEGPNEKE